MKKIKNEKELVKKAIEIGVSYAEKRGAVEFEATDSAHDKLEYIYRLLVHDKLLQPLPENQDSVISSIRHFLHLLNQGKSFGGLDRFLIFRAIPTDLARTNGQLVQLYWC